MSSGTSKLQDSEFPARSGSACGAGARGEGQAVRAIVLAGVHTWGNCLLERTLCRPLLPIATQPLVGHVLDWLRLGGVAHASICGNSDTAILHKRLGDGTAARMALEYFEDVTPRGPAGCLRDASHGAGAWAYVVVEGTILPRVDLARLLDSHKESGAAVTVVTTSPTGEQNGGNGFPHPAGIYVFSSWVLETVPAMGYQDIKETLLPKLSRLGERVVSYPVPSGSIQRVSGLASYLRANMQVVEQMGASGSIPDGFARVGEATVHHTARCDRRAQIVGPVLIGADCKVGPEAVVVGPTVIGPECEIGPSAVISRSVLWARCRVGRNAHLDHCVLSDEALVRPNTILNRSVHAGPRESFLGRAGEIARFMVPALLGRRGNKSRSGGANARSVARASENMAEDMSERPAPSA